MHGKRINDKYFQVKKYRPLKISDNGISLKTSELYRRQYKKKGALLKYYYSFAEFEIGTPTIETYRNMCRLLNTNFLSNQINTSTKQFPLHYCINIALPNIQHRLEAQDIHVNESHFNKHSSFAIAAKNEYRRHIIGYLNMSFGFFKSKSSSLMAKLFVLRYSYHAGMLDG